MTRTRTTWLAGHLILAMAALAACSSGSPQSEPPAATPGAASAPATPGAASAPATPGSDATEAPPGQSQAAAPAATQGEPPAGASGAFTVNDTEYAVTSSLRCIPFTDETGNIDLISSAQGAQLLLLLDGGFVEVSVQGPAIQETFGSIAFSSYSGEVSESALAGDRWMGSATLADALESGKSVEVTWDVVVPPQAIDCSL